MSVVYSPTDEAEDSLALDDEEAETETSGPSVRVSGLPSCPALC